jgi:hypothetical protein
VHPHDTVERGEQFLSYNVGSTEIEVSNWLYATILLLKPRHILETGAADGLGTMALASACKANGFGLVHSVEIDSAACTRAEQSLKRSGLSDWVQYHCDDSRRFLKGTSIKFEFGFFDSLCEIRAEECEICMTREILSGPAVFHDTSPYRTLTWTRDDEEAHAKFRWDLQRIGTRYFDGNFSETTLSRGLTILLPRRYPSAEHCGHQATTLSSGVRDVMEENVERSL